jgi:adenylate kinase family enzyme
MKKRVVIIGNSGSGKSHLACLLGAKFQLPVVQLDSIFWLPGGFNEKRSTLEVEKLIEVQRSSSEWIVEGVFGELAGRFLDYADLMIWLDLPWSECEASLHARGSESSKQRDPIEAKESFRKLLDWASAYWTRTNARSHLGHMKLFDRFEGAKFRFEQRSDVDAFLEETQRQLNQAVQSTAASPRPLTL